MNDGHITGPSTEEEYSAIKRSKAATYATVQRDGGHSRPHRVWDSITENVPNRAIQRWEVDSEVLGAWEGMG